MTTMEDIPHAPKLAPGAGLAAGTSMPRDAASCWQTMTRLAIDNRADAIDYLVRADPAPRLSTDELAALLDAFPALPTTSHTSAAAAGSREIR